MDRYGYIGIETLLNYCENSKDHVVTPNDFMRMNRVRNINCSEFPNNWIPCSERLPEDKDYDETFSVTIQCEHVDGWDDYVTGYADWTPHGWDIQSYYLGQIKVTAWMPLPSPYHPEEE